MNQKIGKASMKPELPVYILSSASVVGPKEGAGPLGELFDMVGEDDLFGCNTWEEAESNLQKDAVSLALGKAGLKPWDISCIFAGDLLGQSIATSFGISSYEIPLLGLYGACSTCGESLLLGTVMVAGGFAEKVLCVTSSHFASAEKEFRFPLEYGNQRPLSAHWTVTGSGAFVLSREAAIRRDNGSCGNGSDSIKNAANSPLSHSTASDQQKTKKRQACRKMTRKKTRNQTFVPEPVSPA